MYLYSYSLYNLVRFAIWPWPLAKPVLVILWQRYSIVAALVPPYMIILRYLLRCSLCLRIHWSCPRWNNVGTSGKSSLGEVKEDDSEDSEESSLLLRRCCRFDRGELLAPFMGIVSSYCDWRMLLETLLCISIDCSAPMLAFSLCFSLLECWIGRGCGCVRRELSVSFALQNFGMPIYGKIMCGEAWNFGALSVRLDLALPLDRCIDELWGIPPVKFHLDRGIIDG